MKPEPVMSWMCESPNVSTATVSERVVSGNQASIPAPIREQADIEDGDKLRWY